MKKILTILATLTTLTAFTSAPIVSAMTFVAPATPGSATVTFELTSIKTFLENYEIVSKCLRNRNNQENAKITLGIAVCSILQVFDQNSSGRMKPWEKAKKVGLIGNDRQQTDALKGVEFLSLLFDASGITISPLSEDNYRVLLGKLLLRLKKDELHVIAIALENGLVPEPQTAKDATTLRAKLLNKPLKISDALAFLYQISTSQHPETTAEFSPINQAEPVALEGILNEIVGTIKSQSYFSSSFDEKAAMEAAIKALVKSLKEDKYIEYYTEKEFESFSSGLNGSLEGIGAYIEEKEGKITIVSPIEGGPAAKAGVHPGDIITRIDGVSVEGLSLQEAIQKIRGPQGSTVKLSILRDQMTLEISITREKITIPAVTSQNKDGVEVIKIVQFGSSVSSEMLAELKTIPQKNPKGIIIDLRNDPGGFLNEVVTIVSYFLEKGKPVVFLKDQKRSLPIMTNEDPLIQNIPIAILINKGSASASEILAGAMQSYGLAKVYGETSYGKGTVQNIITLQDSGLKGSAAFKFTTAEYLIGNPNGDPISINGIGVKPNDNPGGADQVLLDNEKTTDVDEALDVVVNIMNKSSTRRQ